MIKEILQTIKNEIIDNVKTLGYYQEDIDVVLEIPKDKENGDYSTNIAMRLARVARKAPMVIANEIINLFNKEKTHVSKVEAAGSGFINFTLDTNYLLNIVLMINEQGSNYGSLTIGNNKKVMVEFVSANPTGYLHLGHGRGAAYGDSLGNVMKKAGYDVTKEHYVNDAGNQITNMGLSVYERYKELFGLPIKMEEDYYYGKEIITIAEKIKEEYEDKFLNNFKYIFVGLIDIIVGIILVSNLGVSAATLPIIFALWCIAVGSAQLVSSYHLSKNKMPWGWSLSLGLLGIVFGFLILQYPALGTITISTLLGLYIIMYGIVEIIEYFYFKNIPTNYE